MIEIHHALSSLRPKAEFTIRENDIKQIIWHDTKQDRPSDAEIEAEVVRLQAEYDSNAYARNRSVAYRLETDHLFFEEQAGEIENGAWQAKRNEIKARFPK